MRVRVLGAGPGGGFPLTGFLIDGELAVDAGPLGHAAPPAELAQVRHVLLTHAHLDHTAGLPVFLDTVYGLAAEPPAVWGTAATLDALRTYVFNGVLMPDFVALSARLAPFLTLHELTPDVPAAVGRYTVTPLPVDHTVPTVGFVVDDGAAAVAVVTDTAPVPVVLDRLAAWPRLKLVLLEASFPDSEASLAAVSRHLTVSQFRALAARLPAAVPVRAIHVKPRWAAEIGAAVPVAEEHVV
jgi:ribonuclease BN (tRNA processing enzyme)